MMNSRSEKVTKICFLAVFAGLCAAMLAVRGAAGPSRSVHYELQADGAWKGIHDTTFFAHSVWVLKFEILLGVLNLILLYGCWRAGYVPRIGAVLLALGMAVLTIFCVLPP